MTNATLNNQQITVLHGAKSRKLIVKKGKKNLYLIDIALSTGKHTLHLDIIPKQGASIYVVVLVALSGDAQLFVRSNQKHNEPHSFSDFMCKVVLEGRSKFSYNGTINITKKAQHAHAYQRNENLLMSSEAHVSSEPKLQIQANEVFCTHGATIGCIPKDILYYMASRGMSSKCAQKLVSNGFLLSGVEKLNDISGNNNSIDLNIPLFAE